MAGGMQALGAVSALSLVIASKLALDALIGVGETHTASLIMGLIVLVLASAVSAAVGALQRQQQRLLAERLGQFVWRDLLRTLTTTSLAHWEDSAFIQRLEQVRSNALQRTYAVVTGVFGTVGSVVGATALLIALVFLHPLLVPVLVVAGVPVLYISKLAGRREFAFAQETALLGRKRLYLKQLLTSRANAAEIKAFDSGAWLIARHHDADVDYLDRLHRHVRRRQRLALASVVVSSLALGLTFTVIVLLVAEDEMSYGDAGAAVIAARLLGTQLGAAFNSGGTLLEAIPFLTQLREFIHDHSSAEPTGVPRDLRHSLVLEGVSYSYDDGHPVVSDVTVRVPRGGVVAIVGENGSGKTTLAKLIAGLFEPSEGHLTWDGEVAPSADIRASVTVLFQDFVRYQMPASDNIMIAQTTRGPDRERMLRAAATVGLETTLGRLADGVDTVLGKDLGDGTDLSGGQWQRLALARAIYRDAPVVVLDEPTSALDPRAEYELFADIRRVLDGRAALLISHRYSSVRLADHIYVLEGGKVLEEGTHQDLLARGGRYAELYNLQAEAFIRDDTPSRPAPRG